MREAIKQKQKRMLRLVKSDDAIKSEQKPMIDSEDYYKQVERYAEQIRKTSSADEIIRILDIVLSETKGLRFSDEVFAAQEQVKHAEQKIESLKSELEQLREIVQTDQMTGAFNRRGLDEFSNAKRLVLTGMRSHWEWSWLIWITLNRSMTTLAISTGIVC